MHTCMNSYIKTCLHPDYLIDHRQWENYVHLFIPDISIAPLKSTTTQRRYRPQQLTLCRSLHAEALQATVSEVKDLPKVPGMASRAGFEARAFRSEGIDPTNVPQRPTNINR